ncbi:MAG: hypothetical protein ACRETP_11780 [Steroidobacteraceae bacterium]
MGLIQRLTVASAFAALLAACASSSHVLVGHARPPISPDQVKIYLEPPVGYEEIATLDASSGSFSSDQKKTDQAMARLKAEAAKLGANGILLQGVEKQQSGSIGVGLGGTSFGNSSAVGGGGGGSGGLYVKAAKGVAIYVPQ